MTHIKTLFNKKSLLIFTVFVSLFCIKSFAQEDKKNANLSVQFIKLMKEHQSNIEIIAQFKEKKIFSPCKNLILSIYKLGNAEDSIGVKIGTCVTNDLGKAKFIIEKKYSGPSSTFTAKIEKSKTYEDNAETVLVKDASIEASIEKTDSTYNIKARLVDENNNPIADEALMVGLKRTFGNLSMGEEDSYTTDADGTIIVPIDKGLSGLDGILNFQVILKENDTYGTVIANLYSKFGVPITDKSTFDKRTMWSPPTKTPLFILIIPNLILVGIWSILTMLLINLYKIYKSKN